MRRLLCCLFVGVGMFSMSFSRAEEASEYKPLASVEASIQALAEAHPANASASSLKAANGADIQTKGPNPKKIQLLKVAKGGPGENRVPILVTGTLHAREWLAYRLAFDTAKYMLERVAGGGEGWPEDDARFAHFRKFKEMDIKTLTDNANIFFVPIVNPEGYDFSRTVCPDPPNDQPGGWRGWPPRKPPPASARGGLRSWCSRTPP